MVLWFWGGLVVWLVFFRETPYISLETKEQNSIKKNNLLKTSVFLLPSAAHVLGETTQLLTKHVTFYYASITHFLWSTMLAFNYHTINSWHSHKLIDISALATEIKQLTQSPPCIAPPTCALSPRHLPGLWWWRFHRTLILLQP